MSLQTSPILRRSLVILFFFLASAPQAMVPASLHAQEEVVPILRGQARAGDGPLTEGMVVLHRVSAETSGEVDSVAVAPDGSFSLLLPHVPDHATRPDIFFASIDHQGLLYFGQAITEAVQLDSVYLIQAYDTLSVPQGGAELPLSGRSLFLEKVAEGWNATDLIQLRQDVERTLYSPEDGVVWSYPLPPSARDFQPGQVDMGPDAVRFLEGRLEVLTPLPPGERYFLVRYRLPQDEFVIPLPGQTDLLEVYVREPGPAVELSPLRLGETAELEPGNVYRSYLGENLLNTQIQALMAPEPWQLPAEWLGIFLAGLLGAAGVYGFRKRSSGRVAALEPARPRTRKELLRAAAALDVMFAEKKNPGSGARKRYQEERQELLNELKRLS